MEFLEAVKMYFVTQPVNQLVALGIFVFLLDTFQWSTTNSYKSSNGGRSFTILKVNNWPGRVIKILWIVNAYAYAENLWVGVSVAGITILVMLVLATKVQPWWMTWAPVIIEEEKRLIKIDEPFSKMVRFPKHR